MAEREISEVTLLSIYTINKLAKIYDREAEITYRKQFNPTAKYKIVRKNTLYDYKSYILKTLYENNIYDSIEHHIINGDHFYCLCIKEYNFHTPISTLTPKEELKTVKDITDTFSSNPKRREDLPMSERKALIHLADCFEKSPNDFLTQTFVPNCYPPYTGWKYLSEK